MASLAHSGCCAANFIIACRETTTAAVTITTTTKTLFRVLKQHLFLTLYFFPLSLSLTTPCFVFPIACRNFTSFIFYPQLVRAILFECLFIHVQVLLLLFIVSFCYIFHCSFLNTIKVFLLWQKLLE